MIERRVTQRDPYVRIPYLQTRVNGERLIDRVAVQRRLLEIATEQNVIARRLNEPLWVPWNGDVSYLCWVDFHASNRTLMPYPGGRLNQPEWFFHDNIGYNDLETWAYLEHELQALLKAIGEDWEPDHA